MWNDATPFGAGGAVELFHINRIVDWSRYVPLEVGDVFGTSAALNPFSTKARGFRVDFLDGLQRRLSSVGSAAPRVDERCFENRAFLQGARAAGVELPHVVGRHLRELATELVVEDVRDVQFPRRPSRLRCVWATQSVEDAIRWLERLGCPDEYQIVRILVDGVMHYGDEQWLLGLHRCANPVRDASAYWRGFRGARPRVEVIFEGRARVEEVVFSHLGLRTRSGSIR